MYRVKEFGIDELDVREWNDLLSKSGVCDAFQTYEWAQVLRNSTDVQPRFFIIEHERETIGGALFLKKKVLKIFDCYEMRGGPLYVGMNKAIVMESILKAFRRERGKSLYALFIPSPLINCGFKEMFKTEGYHPIAFRTIIIDLKRPIEEIWLALDKNARRMVRRAERFGVDVKIASRWQEWEEFYNIHVLHSRKKQYATSPREYFRELFKLHRKNLSCLFIARYGKQIIAGTLFLIDRRNMVYLENSSLEAFLKYNPNNLILWRSIEWALKNGVAIYDMYGLPWEGTTYLRGIYEYKKRWDGYVQWYYYYLDNRLLYGGVHLIRTNIFAWKLFKSLRNYGIIPL